MHRTGTSLVAGMLSLLGVYMDPEFAPIAQRLQSDGVLGAIKPVNLRTGYGEAAAFRTLNDQLLALASADWADPDPLLRQREDARLSRKILVQMARATHGSLLTDYLYKAPETAASDHSVWGWKDPRTSLLLPQWFRLFPKARVIHVRRNSEHIVRSLMRREQSDAVPVERGTPTFTARLAHASRNPAAIVRFAGRRLGVIPPYIHPYDRVLDADYCRELIDKYETECLEHRRDAGAWMEINYDSILRDPVMTARDMSEFVGIQTKEPRIDLAARLVRKPA